MQPLSGGTRDEFFACLSSVVREGTIDQIADRFLHGVTELCVVYIISISHVLQMLLLHLAAKLLNLSDGFFWNVKWPHAYHRFRRISVKLSLSIQTEPEERLYVGRRVELFSYYIASRQEILLHNEKGQKVHFYNHHAYDELYHKHSLVRYCVLSLLSSAFSTPALHSILIFNFFGVPSCHIFQFFIIGI
jgi:hypothetical protein